ncbi:MAG: DUF411 domain-containing protein [Pseudomonadales bacterium]
MNKLLIGTIAGLGLIFALGVGWSMQAQDAAVQTSLKVYKSPTCGCCDDWIKHMQRVGYDIEAVNLSDMSSVKSEQGIAPNLQSCHTAVSTEGYFFEGHIPGKVITAFLKNPPADAEGLAAPGMPMGSPGMEMGKFTPYDVLLVDSDGSTSVYKRIDSPDYE